MQKINDAALALIENAEGFVDHDTGGGHTFSGGVVSGHGKSSQ